MNMKKQKYSLSILLFLITVSLIFSQEINNNIITQPGYISAEMIYPIDKRPTPECHASTIEEISNGFIVAWFGGTE